MENERLREESSRAKWLQAEVDGLRGENAKLSRSLGVKTPARWTPLWADVMERDLQRWYSSILVNAGSAKGVVLNSPVLGELDGAMVAVGRVTEVRSDSSIVLLLTDELSAVSGHLPESSSGGLVQGRGRARMRMLYIPPEAVVAPGGMVHAAAASATFPEGVPIGRVVSVDEKDPLMNYKSADVEPLLRAEALDHVMILLPAKGAEAP
jgi:rod shape-determining protein MreC